MSNESTSTESLNSRPGAGGFSGIQPAVVRPEVPVNEVNASMPLIVGNNDTNRILIQVLGECACNALKLARETVAALTVMKGVEQVDRDRRLTTTTPEAPRPDVGTGGESDCDMLLDASRQAIGINCDCPPGSAKPGDAATDEEFSDTSISEVGKVPTPSRAHDDIIADLDERCGRWDNKRWVFIDQEYNGELKRGGVLVETCWLPIDAACDLGKAFTRGSDGHFRAIIPTKDFGTIALSQALQKVALAFADGRRPQK